MHMCAGTLWLWLPLSRHTQTAPVPAGHTPHVIEIENTFTTAPCSVAFATVVSPVSTPGPPRCGRAARRFISGGSEQAALLITLEQDDQEADYGRICAEHRQDVLAVSSDLGDAVLQARPPAPVIWVRLLQKLTKAVLAVGGAAGSASAPAATRFAVVVVLQDVSLGLHRPA